MSIKPKLRHFKVLFCPCVVKKYSTTRVSASGRMVTLDVVKNFAQRGVRGFYVGIDDLTNGHLIFLPQTLQIITSVDVTFDEKILSALIFKNRSYHEALLTRPISDPPNFSHPTECYGDITDPFMSVDSQTSSTQAELEEKSLNLNSNETIETAPPESVYELNINKESPDKLHLDITDETEKSLNIPTFQEETPPIRKSQQIRKSNFRISGKEWVNTVKEMTDEDIPWSSYGDHTSFLPEPKGLKNVLKLESRDPLAFKLWSRAIRAEIRNLISQGTFSIKDISRDDVVIPTICIFKIKLQSDGTKSKRDIASGETFKEKI